MKAAVEAYDSGELQQALEDGEAGFKAWLKGVGKSQGRKGKRLFLPMRVALTGSLSVSRSSSCPVLLAGAHAQHSKSISEVSPSLIRPASQLYVRR